MTSLTGTKTSTKESKEMYDMKERAMKYYAGNGVPSRMEEILNTMFQENPADVYGHLANFFEDFAKDPAITKLQGHLGYDSRGQPTLQTDIYCMIKNKEKLVSSIVSSSVSSHLLDNAKVEDRTQEEEERMTSINAAIKFINKEISDQLEGLVPTSQADADTIAYNFIQVMMEKAASEKEAVAAALAAEAAAATTESSPSPRSDTKKAKPKAKRGKGNSSVVSVTPDEPKEIFADGSCLVSAVSQCLCTAGAVAQSLPLYHYIASLKNTEFPNTLNIPLPMVTIIQSGKAAHGKSNCIKEYMVIPKPTVPLRETMPKIMALYSHVSKALSVKGGLAARSVNDQGALCPSFEKPEQGLDLIMEAMTALGMTPGEHFSIGLNIAAHEMFDYDKGKYEVTSGQLKVTDDYVEFLVELIGRYPAVNVIIDPLRKQDRSQWMRFCERVSVAAFIVGDYGYHRPGILKDDILDEFYQTSGIMLRWEQMTTLTDLIAVTKQMEEAYNEIIITSSQGETSGSILADLAVGLNARFIKIGAPCRGERISKLNRLLQIEKELSEKGILGYHSAHFYPRIEIPPAPSMEEGEEAEGASTLSPSTKESSKKSTEKSLRIVSPS